MIPTIPRATPDPVSTSVRRITIATTAQRLAVNAEYLTTTDIYLGSLDEAKTELQRSMQMADEGQRRSHGKQTRTRA